MTRAYTDLNTITVPSEWSAGTVFGKGVSSTMIVILRWEQLSKNLTGPYSRRFTQYDYHLQLDVHSSEILMG